MATVHICECRLTPARVNAAGTVDGVPARCSFPRSELDALATTSDRIHRIASHLADVEGEREPSYTGVVDV